MGIVRLDVLSVSLLYAKGFRVDL